MSKSKPWQLTEKKGIRTTKLHFHRLGRFVRFLRDSDIEVIFREDNKKIIYSGDGRDGQPSILDLLIEALDISPGKAEDYFSKKLGIDDTHSSTKDKIYGDGLIIEGIHPYFNSDGSIQKEVQKFSKYNYFYRPDNDTTSAVYFLWEVFWEELNSLSKYIQELLVEMITGSHTLSGLPLYESFPFKEEIEEILAKETGHLKELEHYLQIYKDFEKSNRGHLLIPGLSSFVYAHKPEQSLIKLKRNEENCRNLLTSSTEDNYEEILENRYQLMWLVKRDGISISQLRKEIIALFHIAIVEFYAVHNLIAEIAIDTLSDLRFMIYGMDKENMPSYQKDSITIENLSDVLSSYVFNKGLDHAINPRARNIIRDRLMKIPEEHAARGNYSSEDLNTYFRQAFANQFFSQIASDFGLCDTKLKFSDI